MGNPVNVFDIEGQDLATFLASSISDGTWADVFTTEKVDESIPSTEATAIETNVGALWGNAVDDYIQATYPLVRGAVQGPASCTDNAIVRWDGTNGRLVKNSAVTIDNSGNIATAGTVDGRDVSVDGAALDAHVASTANPHTTTLAQALAAGSGATGANSIVVDNGQAIFGEDGGSIAFEAVSGLIVTSATSVGDPGSESDSIIIGGSPYDAQLKVASLGDASPLASIVIDRHSTSLPPIILAGRSNSADDTHGAVVDTDELLAIYAAGWDGTDYAFGGYVGFKVDGTPGSNDMPTRFVVGVSQDGSGSPTNRLVIEPDGTTTLTGTLTVTGYSVSRVQGSTARGSTNTQIFRWTSEVEQSGASITYTDSATDGGYWTINDAGIYAISVSLDPDVDGAVAIKAAAALSNTLLETSIRAIEYLNSNDVSMVINVAWTGPLSANDKVWIAGFAQNPLTTLANSNTCTITRIH